ncbi:MAG: hypothetical protein QT05_C0014G0002 [archaeon GW2011_AR13]|nr:MAG: hypothetical protein QT05_C0014G0002 [archaeon GW2011_AR13]HIG94104.1 DUF86 domain-containing protein [Nanoarchaeota archaeon]HIH63315.1 DUF86 domain-containing protein [Nanoarchaeota archaeon]HIJ09956.1 DUF86 domain-containing protein [Nanoarchaeota archaeon]
MKRDLILFVEDILQNIELIEESIKNISKLKFETNKLLIDATVRRIEVIGEAAKNLPEVFKNKYPNVEWRKIAGTRDIIIHAYFGIDLDIIWNIIKNDLSKLKKEMENILNKENKNNL